MPREQTYTAVILKKQPLGEADELITFFTKEAGKIRALAKSVKSAKSRLQQKLQTLFLLDLRLAGGKLPKVIGAETLKVYASLRQSLPEMKLAFYAVELVLKFTADEQKNLELFQALADMLEFLDQIHEPAVLELALAKFKITVLQTTGFGISHPQTLAKSANVFFNQDKGTFIADNTAGSLPVSSQTAEAFMVLSQKTFTELNNLPGHDTAELQNLLSRFIEYQLERKIKSEKYLGR